MNANDAQPSKPGSGDAARNLDYFRGHSSGCLSCCLRIDSSRPGKHVLIVGATHGNEPAGVRAMHRLHAAFNRGELSLKQGEVSLLLGNPQAYSEDVRYIDYDLNRAFGRREHESTMEGKRAREIARFLRQNSNIDAVLDIHSVSIGDFRIVVYNKEKAQNAILASAISNIPLHLAYHAAHIPGTLIDQAGGHRIPGLMVECGNHGSPHGTETALRHIESLLLRLDILACPRFTNFTEPQELCSIEQYETIQGIAPAADFMFLLDDIQTGTRLLKGQKFALDSRGYHVAPEDCYVVAPSKEVKATDVDAGLLCRLKELKRLVP